MWQAEADSISSLSALPTTAVGQILFSLAKFSYYTVLSKLYAKNCYITSNEITGNLALTERLHFKLYLLSSYYVYDEVMNNFFLYF